MRTSTNSTPSGNAIARDFQNVVDDAHELLKTVQNEGEAKVVQARTKLQDSFDAARVKLGEMGATAQESAKVAVTQTDEFVHAHPWQAIGAGAALGALIGFLLARR